MTTDSVTSLRLVYKQNQYTAYTVKAGGHTEGYADKTELLFVHQLTSLLRIGSMSPTGLQAGSDSSPVSERPRTTVSVGALHPGLQC